MNRPGNGVEATMMDLTDKCEIIVMYEDISSRAAAMEVCQRLRIQLQDKMQLMFDFWKLKYLGEPELARRASEAAARAEVVIFCTHGGALPPGVESWLQQSIKSRTKADGALVLVLAEPFNTASASGRLVSSLHAAAQEAHMDFLPLLPHGGRQSKSSLPSQKSQRTPGGRGGMEQHPPSHWGINE
jgi:hypothetical protein